MFNKKCSRCGRKIEKDFEFCPYCGKDYRLERRINDERDFGFLGKEDELFPEISAMSLDIGMPLGKIFGSLLKQVDMQMRELDKNIGKEESEFKKLKKIPGIKSSGISISISSKNNNKPEIRVSGFGPEFENMRGNIQIQDKKNEKRIEKPRISEEMARAMSKLPRKEAETNVRRLSNKIIYEVSLPEVKDMNNIIINKLENSIEIKAFTKDKVYFKLLPVNLPIIDYKLEKEKLILELKTK